MQKNEELFRKWITIKHSNIQKNGSISRRGKKQKKYLKIFFRRARKGRDTQKHHSTNQSKENQSQGENPGSSPRKITPHIQGNPTKLTSDFYSKNIRRQWDKIVKNQRKKTCRPGILYPAKLS